MWYWEITVNSLVCSTACLIRRIRISVVLLLRPDQQTLKLQENPESVPTGEMPRHVMLSCERYLVDRAVPG